MGGENEPFREDFLRQGKQRRDGCWVWTGRQRAGYGVLRIGDKERYAHRVAWELHHGKNPFPASHVVACHACDEPLCVRAEHLWLGDAADSWLDLQLKGRGHAPPILVRRATGAALAPHEMLGVVADYLAGTLPLALFWMRYGVHPVRSEPWLQARLAPIWAEVRRLTRAARRTRPPVPPDRVHRSYAQYPAYFLADTPARRDPTSGPPTPASLRRWKG
jgi:HNH endonuclease